jgi:hypothetical protein
MIPNPNPDIKALDDLYPVLSTYLILLELSVQARVQATRLIEMITTLKDLIQQQNNQQHRSFRFRAILATIEAVQTPDEILLNELGEYIKRIAGKYIEPVNAPPNLF